MEYMYTGLHTCIGRPTNKMNYVHVICGVTDVRQYRGRLHGYLEDKIYHQRGFTSGEIFFFQHVVPNTMIVFFGTPRLHRQKVDGYDQTRHTGSKLWQYIKTPVDLAHYATKSELIEAYSTSSGYQDLKDLDVFADNSRKQSEEKSSFSIFDPDE
ncbi:hypothetical protein CHS0354_034146 [Potamilus streckersoni]|uniref:Uncharacterized protein n=1 Tax=Potamilus streckersoni TaxID=2493646 RepID=A0AAE0SLZ1_9BIVA|nr:hypothetical protein CHS0354_034146 [Potamilus streckersoni]